MDSAKPTPEELRELRKKLLEEYGPEVSEFARELVAEIVERRKTEKYKGFNDVIECRFTVAELFLMLALNQELGLALYDDSTFLMQQEILHNALSKGEPKRPFDLSMGD